MQTLMKFNLIGLIGMYLFLTGCSGLPAFPTTADLFPKQEVHIEVPVKAGSTPVQREGKEITLLISDYIDARTRLSRKVGDIRTTVTNMSGDALILDQDVASLVSVAIRKQLSHNGFRVVQSASEAHDFELIGVINNFSLDIADRDYLAITVETTLTDGKTGKVLWSGIIADIRDRFAGITGNSRSSITEYLGNSIAGLADKTSASVRDGLVLSYPLTMEGSLSKNDPEALAVKTLHAATSREVAAKPKLTYEQDVKSGYLSIVTIPARAKIYIGDVYYGISPLKLAIDPGVYLFRFELDGYKPGSEKVSVRRAETTELEIKLFK